MCHWMQSPSQPMWHLHIFFSHFSLSYGTENSVVIIDLVQKSIVLNVCTSSLYGNVPSSPCHSITPNITTGPHLGKFFFFLVCMQALRIHSNELPPDTNGAPQLGHIPKILTLIAAARRIVAVLPSPTTYVPPLTQSLTHTYRACLTQSIA